MPAKSKVNYRAAAHSDDLSTIAVRVHKMVLKGSPVPTNDLDSLIRLANDLARELRGPVVETFDPFLTEAPTPKQPDVAKLPTVQVPIVEKPAEKQKSGFLGR